MSEKAKIWLSSPHMGGTELDYIKEAFDLNWIAPIGPHVNAFEQKLAEYTGAKHVAVLTSGTAALHLALIMLNVQAGDEVLCQSITFSGSANPIAYQSARPVFIGSEAQTWNMDPNALEDAIKDRRAKGKNVKAIIPVHLYGMPAMTDEIMYVAQKYDIPVIEDAAESLGARYKGRHTGTDGLMGILSFNGNKIITTSGGGALMGDDEKLIQQARFLSQQARDNAVHYQHSRIGYNYRMSNVLAAIGMGQMEVLDQRVERKREIHSWYENLMKDFPAVHFLPEPEGFHATRWLTCILIDPKIAEGKTANGLFEALQDDNIDARPLWKPMHMQPVFEGMPYFGSQLEEELFANGLCLPSGTNMSESDKSRIEKVIRSYFA